MAACDGSGGCNACMAEVLACAWFTPWKEVNTSCRWTYLAFPWDVRMMPFDVCMMEIDSDCAYILMAPLIRDL